MNEAIEAYSQFSDMSEVFSLKNARLLWKYLFLFGQGCLIALKMYMAVLLSGLVIGGMLGKAARKSAGVRLWLEGYLQTLSALVVVALMPLHFFIAVLFQLDINPLITIPAAFSLMNIVIVGRTVSDSLEDFYQKALDCKPDGASVLRKRLFAGLIVSQAVILNVMLFLTLIIITDVFGAKAMMALIPPQYDAREIYGAFALFFGLTAYAIQYTAMFLKKFVVDRTYSDEESS